MNKKKLKDSILVYAFRGELTSHKKNESTSHNSSINENPFSALPENWELKKIGDVFDVVSARRVKKSDWRSQGVPFYRAREIVKLSERGYIENEIFIDENLYLQYSNSKSPIPGDLMISAVGTLGKSYVVKPGDKFYYKDASVLCLKNINNLVPEYVKYYLDSPYFVSQITSNSKGTTVGTLTIVRMNDYLIPVPPLEEQQAIVKKIDELVTKIDYYNLRYTELEKLQERIPSLLDKSILQYAIEGKLVKQDISNEPASELLKRISEQKEQMVKEKVIKKEKPLPPITEEEIPFDIPDTWEWVRLQDVALITMGQSPEGTSVSEGIDGIEFHQGKSLFSKMYLTKSNQNTSNPKKIANAHSIIMSVRAPVGDVNILKDRSICIGRGLASIEPLAGIDLYYLNYYLQWAKPILESRSTGSTFKAVNLSVISRLTVPLPPTNEQIKIVKEIQNISNSIRNLNLLNDR